MSYLATVAGSSTANFVFICLFFIGNFIRKRLIKSKCESHCYLFDCEAQLLDLQHVKTEVQTQRGLLQNVIELLDGMSLARGVADD